MNEVKDDLSETLENDLVLTTIDNPFNPKTQYSNWKTWDERLGYYTEAYIARVANVPLDVDIDDDVLIDQFVRQAYQSILDHDDSGLYVLV